MSGKVKIALVPFSFSPCVGWVLAGWVGGWGGSALKMVHNCSLIQYTDGESGIQALDFSCAVPIGQKEFDLPHSSSATEKGSNQIVGGFFPESRIRKNASLESKALKLASSSHKVKQIDGEIQSGPQDLASVSDFQGENQPLNFARTRLHETGIHAAMIYLLFDNVTAPIMSLIFLF